MGELMCSFLTDIRNWESHWCHTEHKTWDRQQQEFQTGNGRECPLVPCRLHLTWWRPRRSPVPSGKEGRELQKLRVLVSTLDQGFAWQETRWPWGGRLERQSVPDPGDPQFPPEISLNFPLKRLVGIRHGPVRRPKPYHLFVKEKIYYKNC